MTALRAQADEGIEHVIVNLPDAHVLERLEAFGREDHPGRRLTGPPIGPWCGEPAMTAGPLVDSAP